ncbi:hypothetical protein GUITHDRAFT_118713 [Guillardia theta CCMP2712]|uniref:Uncharacterized protein n=1 Tax=Guillardia theta (strain CCMP2712) TaxID=905079 RepID=L1IGK7_GUITC|nr:hypothetical protein GUITHDRAFT_118713 [Guillardia theta CCMP2712]EKX35059.1 hypothetical protein GUITHDRAFT_118713 [Guillardia theta CCMP2712]|eukprot:XP_005822039.1 hypothetical protein GUITHDRAFT_118713 [Guillardia theta CCMP2712]
MVDGDGGLVAWLVAAEDGAGEGLQDDQLNSLLESLLSHQVDPRELAAFPAQQGEQDEKAALKSGAQTVLDLITQTFLYGSENGRQLVIRILHAMALQRKMLWESLSKRKFESGIAFIKLFGKLPSGEVESMWLLLIADLCVMPEAAKKVSQILSSSKDTLDKVLTLVGTSSAHEDRVHASRIVRFVCAHEPLKGKILTLQGVVMKFSRLLVLPGDEQAELLALPSKIQSRPTSRQNQAEGQSTFRGSRGGAQKQTAVKRTPSKGKLNAITEDDEPLSVVEERSMEVDSESGPISRAASGARRQSVSSIPSEGKGRRKSDAVKTELFVLTLDNASSSHRVQGNIAATVATILQDEKNLSSLAEHHLSSLVTPLLRLFRKSHGSAQEHALRALGNLFAKRGCTSLLHSLDTLTDVVEDPPKKVSSSRSADFCVQVLLHPLLQVLLQGSARAQQYAALLVANLACDEAVSRIILDVPELIEVVQSRYHDHLQGNRARAPTPDLSSSSLLDLSSTKSTWVTDISGGGGGGGGIVGPTCGELCGVALSNLARSRVVPFGAKTKGNLKFATL